MPIIDDSHNVEAAGLYLADLVAEISMGMMNKSGRGDLERNLKLLGENGFGSTRYAQLIILKNAWPMIERETAKLNESRLGKDKAPIDIVSLRSRFDKIYEDYEGIIKHIAELKAVSDTDATDLIDQTARNDFLVLPNKTCKGIIESLQVGEQAKIISTLRGGAHQDLQSVRLAELTHSFEKAAKKLANYDLRKYESDKYPNEFDKIYRQYLTSSNALKTYLKNTIIDGDFSLENLKKGEKGLRDAQLMSDAIIALEQIKNIHDKAFHFYYGSINPAPGLKSAITEYESALNKFYSTIEQGPKNYSVVFDEKTEKAYQQLMKCLDDAILNSAHSPSQVEALESLKEKHIQDKLYIIGKCNAQHIRGKQTFPEEVFDHPELWEHLERSNSIEVDKFFEDLHEQLPGTAVLTEQLSQSFWGTPLKAFLHTHGYYGQKPSIAGKNLDISFNKEGHPIINCMLEIDYLIDPLTSTIHYANEEGILQSMSFDDVEVEEVAKKMKTIEHSPIAKLSYQLTLDSPNMQHMRIKSLDGFKLSLAEGLLIPHDIAPEVAKSQAITEVKEKNLSIRDLCHSAGIGLPQSRLQIDKKSTVEEDEASQKSHIETHKAYKQTLHAIKQEHTAFEDLSDEELSDPEKSGDEYERLPYPK